MERVPNRFPVFAAMHELCIHDLAERVGGSLRLSEMPPLAGAWAPIRRIVFDSRDVLPGDVFWCLPGAHRDGACYAEDAFLRSALGVVAAGRFVQPWAGAFSLQVDDTQRALRCLTQRPGDEFRRGAALEFSRPIAEKIGLPNAAEKDIFLRLCCPQLGVINPPAMAMSAADARGFWGQPAAL